MNNKERSKPTMVKILKNLFKGPADCSIIKGYWDEISGITYGVAIATAAINAAKPCQSAAFILKNSTLPVRQ